MCFTGASSTLPLISLCASIKANRLPGIQNAILHISAKVKVTNLSTYWKFNIVWRLSWHCKPSSESARKSVQYAQCTVCVYTCQCVSDWSMWLLAWSCSKINTTVLTVPPVECTELVFVFSHRSMVSQLLTSAIRPDLSYVVMSWSHWSLSPSWCSASKTKKKSLWVWCVLMYVESIWTL